ncbi:unnamed protein product, partial [Didymodactylos carnosus]
MQYYKQHSYRKVEQLEREIIVGLVEQFGNSAPAIANFVRSSGQNYGDIGFYYQQIAYGSARKRVYDILKRAAQSIAVQRARDDLWFTLPVEPPFVAVPSPAMPLH